MQVYACDADPDDVDAHELTDYECAHENAICRKGQLLPHAFGYSINYSLFHIHLFHPQTQPEWWNVRFQIVRVTGAEC